MFALALVVATLIPADAPSLATLMEFDALQSTLSKEPNALRVVDVRQKKAYDAGHVPGAIWFDLKMAETLASRPGGLQDRDSWQGILAQIGAMPDTRIVVYGDNKQLDAARAWWLFTYLGAEHVALLNGNYSLWASENRPMSKEAAKVDAVPFPVRMQKERLATREDILRLLKDPGTTKVVDARTQGEHSGAEKRSKKAGRIPSACHLEWSTLVDKDGRFLKPEALKAKLTNLGVKPGEPLVTHCQSGGRASVDAFALELAGHPTKNYYLGWSDWGNAEDVPVEAGPSDRSGK